MLNRFPLNLTLPVLMIGLVFLVAGCGSKDEKAQAEVLQNTDSIANEAVPPAPAAAQSTASRAIAAARSTTATHDCDRGCGMTAVPMVQLTEVDGKYYCAGCVEHAK